MVQELLELQEILQQEAYKVCEISYMQMSIQCKKFGTKFTLEFHRGDNIAWEKDTYILMSSDKFQYFQTTHKSEVLNILHFVRHCMSN